MTLMRALVGVRKGTLMSRQMLFSTCTSHNAVAQAMPAPLTTSLAVRCLAPWRAGPFWSKEGMVAIPSRRQREVRGTDNRGVRMAAGARDTAALARAGCPCQADYWA